MPRLALDERAEVPRRRKGHHETASSFRERHIRFLNAESATAII